MNTPPENTKNSILFPMEYPFDAMKFLSKNPMVVDKMRLHCSL